MACLFAFQVTYIQIHLLTEPHYDVAAAANAFSDHHSEEHHKGDHEHGTHQPHSAGDHEIQLTGKQKTSFALIAFLLPETSLFLTPPKPLEVYSIEHGSRPDASPPDPRQPRAPPTA